MLGNRRVLYGVTGVAIGIATILGLRHRAGAPDLAHAAGDNLIFMPLLARSFTGPFPPAPTAIPPSATPTTPPTSTYTPTPEATPTPSDTPEPTETPTDVPTPTPKLPVWHVRVNYYRALAGLGPVTENAVWSRGDALHAKYIVRTGQAGHTEDRSSPWFTQEGLEAAQNGNVFIKQTSRDEQTPSQEPVDIWMTGPFHMTPIIDPKLQVSGFGEHREKIGMWWNYGATLDVLRGRTGVSPGTRFPVRYPEDGAVLPALSFDGNEFPDPLTSCAGYTAPTGPPVALILGAGDVKPSVSKTSFKNAAGEELVHCSFDETNYRNSNKGLQDVGRGGLAMRSAVIVMPKAPLTAGARYTVSITANGKVNTWSFTTGRGVLVDAGEALWR